MKAWRCVMGRHDDVLQVEGQRMFLRCASCGRMTPGWDLHRVDDQERQQLRAMLHGPRPAAAIAGGSR